MVSFWHVGGLKEDLEALLSHLKRAVSIFQSDFLQEPPAAETSVSRSGGRVIVRNEEDLATQVVPEQVP